MATVHFSAALRGFTGGLAAVVVAAATVRPLNTPWVAGSPGRGHPLRKASSVAINGEIIADAEFEELPDGAEVHFLDMHQGG